MNRNLKHTNCARLAVAACLTAAAWGQALTPELKAKVDARAGQLRAWGTDPVVVAAVSAYNAAPPVAAKAMTNEKWRGLSLLDPMVRSYTRNAVAEQLKGKRDATVSEAFVSGADGTKVAFLSKTSSWSHKDKDKHRVPMTGKTWIGPVEVDESSGQLQVQVAIPVLDGAKPIGSIVVGLSTARLK